MKMTILILSIFLSNFAHADGFGTDLLFDNLIAPSNLIARTACPDFKISADERLQVFAQEDSFTIQSADGSLPVSILVPSQGNYVFQGQSPDRIGNEIVSENLHVRAFMNSGTTDITIEKLGSNEQPCTLSRCAAFGVCQ